MTHSTQVFGKISDFRYPREILQKSLCGGILAFSTCPGGRISFLILILRTGNTPVQLQEGEGHLGWCSSVLKCVYLKAGWEG